MTGNIVDIFTEFIEEMSIASTDDYEQIKLMLLSVNLRKPCVVYFLNEAFALAEEKRPLLLCMEGGVSQ